MIHFAKCEHYSNDRTKRKARKPHISILTASNAFCGQLCHPTQKKRLERKYVVFIGKKEEMPQIYKPKRKVHRPSQMKKERQRFYQDTQYRKARDWYIQKNCLCVKCKEEGLVTPSTDLHHILSPFDSNISEMEKWNRLHDTSNWMPLCKYHHRKMHGTTSKEEDKEHQMRIDWDASQFGWEEMTIKQD